VVVIEEKKRKILQLAMNNLWIVWWARQLACDGTLRHGVVFGARGFSRSRAREGRDVATSGARFSRIRDLAQRVPTITRFVHG
jgi:hypothetical protein